MTDCCREFVVLLPGGCTEDMVFWSLRGFSCRRLEDGHIEATIVRDCDWLLEDGTCKHEDHRPRLCRGEQQTTPARRAVEFGTVVRHRAGSVA